MTDEFDDVTWADRLRAWRGGLERGVKRLWRGGPGERWVNAPYVSDTAPVLVGGCGRSGTTLLAAMLDSHARLCCGPESRLFPNPGVNPDRLAELYHIPGDEVRRLISASGSKGQFIESFAAAYCQRSGKARWAEKTPGNVRSLDYIFERFPRAKFIHMIRDGRDVVCSLRTHPKYKLVKGERVETGIRRPVRPCAERWVRYVRAGLRWRGDPRYAEVRYEELVADTAGTLRRVTEFLGEPWDDAMLRYYERQPGSAEGLRAIQNPGADRPVYTSALGRWRNDLKGAELDEFYQIAGPLMDELGYGRG